MVTGSWQTDVAFNRCGEIERWFLSALLTPCLYPRSQTKKLLINKSSKIVYEWGKLVVGSLLLNGGGVTLKNTGGFNLRGWASKPSRMCTLQTKMMNLDTNSSLKNQRDLRRKFESNILIFFLDCRCMNYKLWKSVTLENKKANMANFGTRQITAKKPKWAKNSKKKRFLMQIRHICRW